MAEQDSYLNFKVDNSFKDFQDEQQDGWKDEWAEQPTSVEPIVLAEDVAKDIASVSINTSPDVISPLPEAPADKSHLGLSGIETKVEDEESEVLRDVDLIIETKQPKRKSNASYRQSLGVKIETGRSNSLTTRISLPN
jgi:hypothetical protein